jgi:hypothetical protein
MIAWLRKEHPEALPVTRAHLSSPAAEALSTVPSAAAGEQADRQPVAARR